jgi:prepilin-type processing-associated H-X9-DG protein
VTDDSNLAHGKLGKKGRSGGFWSVDGKLNVPHITAMTMCLSTFADVDPNPATITHMRKGVNVTFLDGHVVWMSIDDQTWNYFNSIGWFVSTASDLSCYWNAPFAWASLNQQ